MTVLNRKHTACRTGTLWGIILLLLSACAPVTPAASTSAPTAVSAAAETRPPANTATPPQTPILTALSEPSYTNPVYDNDFPDPHIIRVDDMYFAYGTTNGSSVNIRLMSSPDLL